jgi:hypothetical protein
MSAPDKLFAGSIPGRAAEALAKRFGIGPISGRIQAHVFTAA